MKEYDDYSAKEKKQLAVCQRLITEKSYLSQEEIRRDLTVSVSQPFHDY